MAKIKCVEIYRLLMKNKKLTKSLFKPVIGAVLYSALFCTCILKTTVKICNPQYPQNVALYWLILQIDDHLCNSKFGSMKNHDGKE